MYQSALFEKGLHIYADNLPVSLINLLLAVGKETHLGLMMKLCTDTICHSFQLIKLLTVPDYGYGCDDRYLMDGLLKKWTSLITCVIEFCTTNTSVKHNMMLTRILKHLMQVDDGNYVTIAYGVLHSFKSSIVKKEHIFLLVKISLQFVKHCVEGTWDNLDSTSRAILNTLTKLGNQLDMELPRLIIPVWMELCKFYTSRVLKDIIEVMMDIVKKEAMVPVEMTNMFLKYFESKCRHGEECCDMMYFFKFTDKGCELALKKIVANFENYSPLALLLIAKRQHEETPISEITDSNVFQTDVFNLIRLGLGRFQVLNKECVLGCRYSNLGTETHDCLKYFFGRISEKDNEEVASGKQFQNFMTYLSDSMKGDTKGIVSFLRSLEKTEHMLPKAKERFGTKLIECFQSQFDIQLTYCNHKDYHRVLKEMMQARQVCIEFVDNGAMLFRTAVTNYVKRRHKGKKKCIMLMKEEFKELNED